MAIQQLALSLYVATAAEFAAKNPILLANEVASERDTHVFKSGDGRTAYNNLPSGTNVALGSIWSLWDSAPAPVLTLTDYIEPNWVVGLTDGTPNVTAEDGVGLHLPEGRWVLNVGINMTTADTDAYFRYDAYTYYPGQGPPRPCPEIFERQILGRVGHQGHTSCEMTVDSIDGEIVFALGLSPESGGGGPITVTVSVLANRTA